MRNLVFASLLVLTSTAALAQNGQPKFRPNSSENSGFGLKGGVNFASIKGDGVDKLYSGGADGLTQFHAGAYFQIPVNKWFSVQPEVLYQRKGFKEDGETVADSAGNTSKASGQTVKISYLSVPVMLTFNVFDNLAVQLGPQFSYLLNVHEGDRTPDPKLSKYNSAEFGLVGGLEAKIEFLRVGARYDYSLTDLREGGSFTLKSSPSVVRQAQSDIRNGVFQVYIGVGL